MPSSAPPSTSGLNADKDDLHSAALCAWKEARGEGTEGIRCVLHVISNRAHQWGKSVHDVIYEKNQFTSMSVPSDPEFNLQPPATFDTWIAAQDLAVKVLGGTDADPTHGALYYANLETVTSGWFHDNIVARHDLHPILLKQGHHTFFA